MNIREFVQKNLLFLILVGLGVMMCLVGGVQYLASKSQASSKLEFISAEESQVKGISTAKISIYVAGSVQNEGVYELAEGARIKDALIAAGGLASNADREYIEKKLNLAQKLVDGGKVYIPSKDEIAQLASNTTIYQDEDLSVDTPNSVQEGGLIDINNADEKALDTLPKVGPATIAKIIAGRPYQSIEELISKKIMSQKTFDGLSDMITAN